MYVLTLPSLPNQDENHPSESGFSDDLKQIIGDFVISALSYLSAYGLYLMSQILEIGIALEFIFTVGSILSAAFATIWFVVMVMLKSINRSFPTISQAIDNVTDLRIKVISANREVETFKQLEPKPEPMLLADTTEAGNEDNRQKDEHVKGKTT